MTPKRTAILTDEKRARPSTLMRIASVIPLRRTVVTLVLLVLAGAAEGIGIASLLPLVAAVGPEASQPKGASGKIAHAVESIGLEPTLGLFVTVLIVGMLLKAALTIIAMNRVGRAGADVATKMRLDLIESLLAARWSYYVRQPVGRFSASLSIEAMQSGEAYNSLCKFAAEMIQVVTYLSVVTLFSWQLGLLSVAVGLIMVLTLNRFISMAKRAARKQKKRVSALVGALTDLLVGIKPMKAMGRQARFKELFERDAEAIRKAQRRQSFARDTNKALQEPILAIFIAIGAYVTIGVMEMPTGQVIVMALLLGRTVSTIGKAQQQLQSVRLQQAGFNAISNSIEIARGMREQTRPGVAPAFERGIEFRNVSFAFGDTEVIKDASFEAPKGRVTTITGSSGAGKTTTVDLLLGLHEPSGGEILVDGAPLQSIDLLAWRRLTGYVPQELMLFHDTLRANVTLGQPEFTDEDVARALEQAGAADFVASLPEGVDTVVGERGSRLSGGQRQRISIARALIDRPRLLILDEATTALDPETEAAIVANVVELTRRTGLTVLAISHQPAWARASDNVVHLANGVVTKIDRRAPEWSTPAEPETEQPPRVRALGPMS
ncbi:ABC transporter ATP-binding protein [Hansschlegelia zhihuaiae]|uniref:ABC transporter ATP-binding protein n=1 Tax=Hansschlegelia zhihuaiae TaxID=405005 RepID=A0A4Q0MPF4_9HYPH|nr:ABC transporter ATP-binding protein [Hansschlegelia zhihuaiae]RXF75505.1 ABC transporter ATP-binding protein [Hansschlegelia zhihuaiae]